MLVDGVISHIGRVPYEAPLRETRSIAWVTFGGVYIRREAIDQRGAFDPRCKWAYVMDVDYSLEIRRRGYPLRQVDVNLLHEESSTTREFMALPVYRAHVDANFAAFQDKWRAWPRLLHADAAAFR